MDRNCRCPIFTTIWTGSPPARVAWIETQAEMQFHMLMVAVATREGGVDRNRYYFDVEAANDVATREGGVDRNSL